MNHHFHKHSDVFTHEYIAHRPEFLSVNKFLSEFKTEIDKARVRYNLGIPDELSFSWENIKGQVEDNPKLSEIFENLSKKIDNKLDKTELDTSDIATKDYVSIKIAEALVEGSDVDLSSYLTRIEANTTYAKKSDIPDPYDDSILRELLNDKLDASALTSINLQILGIKNTPGFKISQADIDDWNELISKYQILVDRIETLENYHKNNNTPTHPDMPDDPTSLTYQYIGFVGGDPQIMLDNLNTFKVDTVEGTWSESNTPMIESSEMVLLIMTTENITKFAGTVGEYNLQELRTDDVTINGKTYKVYYSGVVTKGHCGTFTIEIDK